MARLMYDGEPGKIAAPRTLLCRQSSNGPIMSPLLRTVPALVLMATGTAALAAPAPPGKAPVDLLPPATPSASPADKAAADPATVPSPAAMPVPAPAPVPAVPAPVPLAHWGKADAAALLGVIEGIAGDGLFAADYKPAELRAAIAVGEGGALDVAAGQSFTWLAEDLRDGRTPIPARIQYFALDPDMDLHPTPTLMAQALAAHDVAGVLAALDPVHPDYAVLRSALAALPGGTAGTGPQATLIRANMDRWRWLAHDMGTAYLITNVPEYQLRLTVNDKIIRTYRTIVGKPGRTATPQLSETVQAVVFNPTWTVPQSIVVGEGLGQRLLGSRNAVVSGGYRATRAANGMMTVVQQPGPNNSLGLMKIDMPNPHAIYLHDTPSRGLFNSTVRAFSHGCVRTERAQELGMTMAILGAGMTPEQGVANAMSGKYTRVTMTRTFPVYITYFTMAQDITGKLSTFADIYKRDAPLLASFAQPRQLKTSQRISSEAIVKLDNPL